MNTDDIDDFFRTLSNQLKETTTVILTGGAAALIMGGVRPTEDIDFEITTKSPWTTVGEAIRNTELQTQIESQFSEDIDRWSMITLLDYKKHTRPYKTFGKIKVRILEPTYWSIGKMTRYLASDISDMCAVFKEQLTHPTELVSIWKKALKKSPRSEVQFHFQKHVEDFLKEYGPKIWGRDFDVDTHVNDFKS